MASCEASGTSRGAGPHATTTNRRAIDAGAFRHMRTLSALRIPARDRRYGPAVSSRTSVLLFSILSAYGCGGAHMLARDEPVALRAGEGVLALAVDAPEMIVDSLALCRDGAMLDCVQTGRLPRGGGLLVTQLGAGRYCLAQMKIVRDTETLFTHVADEDANPRCFTVEPSVVSYPGHLVMESALASGEMIAFGYGFERRRASIEHQLRAEYPHAAALAIREVRVEPGP